jgi:hypothetical protein
MSSIMTAPGETIFQDNLLTFQTSKSADFALRPLAVLTLLAPGNAVTMPAMEQGC